MTTSNTEDLTGDLLQAIVSAPRESKCRALAILRGAEEEAPKRTEIEPFVSLREAARQIGYSTSSLWRARAPGYELGGKKKVRVGEVLAYLQSDAFKQRAAELKAERRSRKTRRAA